MFDISFGELALIGVVALVVLGPERLPTVARTFGALVGRAQRFVASVKADIQQEANLSGLESIRQDLQDAAHTFRHQLESEVGGAREVLKQSTDDVRTLVDEARQPFVEAEPAPLGSPRPEPLAPESERNENQLELFDDLPPAPPPTSAQTAVSRE